jgi:hypothetical protein
MNVWRCELADARSIRIRFGRSLVSSLVFLFAFSFLFRSWRVVVILAFVYLYMSVLGVFLDRWRLCHPDAPMETERRLRLLAVLPVIAGIPVAIFLFT